MLLPILAAMVALIPLSIDLYLPAFPQIAEQLNTSITDVQATLSIYLMGYAGGMLLFGPLTDILGRRKLALGGLFCFTVFSALLAQSTNINEFTLLRFAQAFTGTAATITVMGTIKDAFGKETSKGISYVSMIMMVAPMLAPALGSFLLTLSSWPIIFYSLTGYGIVILILAWCFLPESTQPNSQPDVKQLWQGYFEILRNRAIRKELLTVALTAVIFFGYITSVSFIYLKFFGVDQSTFSILFAANVGCLMLANFFNTRQVSRFGAVKMVKIGITVASIATLLLVMSVVVLTSFYWFVAALGLLIGSLGLINVNSDALVLMSTDKAAGAATSTIGILRFGMGALAGPLLSVSFDGTLIPFTVLITGCIILVLLIHGLYPGSKNVLTKEG
nr:multidrug effflux MFS transporter [Pleionea sp. CnH1-48]